MTGQIKLITSDNEVISVDLSVIRISKTIDQMLEHLGSNEEDSDEEIPVGNVDSQILRKVIEWATHHKVSRDD